MLYVQIRAALVVVQWMSILVTYRVGEASITQFGCEAIRFS